MENVRNLILAIALSLLVVIGWQALFPPPKPPASAPSKHEAPASSQPAPSASAAASAPPGTTPSASAAWKPSKRTWALENEVVRVLVDERGWIVRAELKRYRQTLDPNSPPVAYVNLAPTGHGLYLNAGVLGHRRAEPFHVLAHTKRELRLESRLDDGRKWLRTVWLSKEGQGYVVYTEDRIKGGAGLVAYHQVVERNPDRKKDTFYEHIGPIALVGGHVLQVDYDELDKQGAKSARTKGGWIGIMNRYFIAALVLDPRKEHELYFKATDHTYQAGVLDRGTTEGDDAVFHAFAYLGPKSIPVLETMGVELERSVDFGWFAFLAKPIHAFLLWLYRYVPNYGVDIILLVVLIKLLFFYPSYRSYVSMAGMRKLQPELERLRAKFGDDRQRLAEEMMKLYRKHKVNPLGGCLPIAIQIPVFFALYKVLLVSIEMRHAPFLGWIRDLSAPDPYYVLPVLMGASMYLQQKMNPKPPDPAQAKLMQLMPAVFTIMFLFFPSGLVLYWFTNNLLSIAQQWLVFKKMGV